MLEINLTTEQRVKISVSPVTAAGKPATLDGAVLFTTDDSGVTIENIDASSAYINAPENPGDVQVNVSGDADLGEGVLNVKDVVMLHVSHPRATSLGLTAGEPELKPPTP